MTEICTNIPYLGGPDDGTIEESVPRVIVEAALVDASHRGTPHRVIVDDHRDGRYILERDGAGYRWRWVSKTPAFPPTGRDEGPEA